MAAARANAKRRATILLAIPRLLVIDMRTLANAVPRRINLRYDILTRLNREQNNVGNK
jgi:hypothetical protein